MQRTRMLALGLVRLATKTTCLLAPLHLLGQNATLIPWEQAQKLNLRAAYPTRY